MVTLRNAMSSGEDLQKQTFEFGYIISAERNVMSSVGNSKKRHESGEDLQRETS